MLLLVKYLTLKRREWKQSYQLTPSSLVLTSCHHMELERAPGQYLFPKQPFPVVWICKYGCSGMESPPITSTPSPPFHPEERDWQASGQVLHSLFLLTGFVLESILGVMGRKIELDFFKGLANEFIHERLQGLSFPSNTSTGFMNQYSPMTFARKNKLLLSCCFSAFLHILAMYWPFRISDHLLH